MKKNNATPIRIEKKCVNPTFLGILNTNICLLLNLKKKLLNTKL